MKPKNPLIILKPPLIFGDGRFIEDGIGTPAKALSGHPGSQNPVNFLGPFYQPVYFGTGNFVQIPKAFMGVEYQFG
jgi:hypothetical protein